MANPRRRKKSERAATYGKGSIYYDEQRQKWAFQPPQIKGERHPRHYHETEEGCRLDQANWLAEHKSGIDMTAGKQLLAVWLWFWHENFIDTDSAAPKYVAWNAQMIRLYIEPALGHHTLRDVNADHALAFRKHLTDNLKPTTARSVYNILRRALDQAVESRKIPYNPCAAVKAPKQPRSRRIAHTLEQSRAILDVVSNHRLLLLYEFALLFGMREGELLGLRWIDVHLAGLYFEITGQVQTIEDETKRHERTKTEDSTRRLPLTLYLKMRLEQQWAMLQRERRDPKWHEHGLVFPSEVGTPMYPRNLLKHSYGVLADAGIIATKPPEIKPSGKHGPQATRPVITGSKVPFHNLRHTALTRLAELAPDHVGRAIAGHAPKDAHGGYLHASLDEMRRAIELLQEKLQMQSGSELRDAK